MAVNYYSTTFISLIWLGQYY